MPKKVSFEGVEHEFPDDFTDEDVSAALAAYVPDRSVSDRAKSNLADLKTDNPFNRTKSLYAGAPDADKSPGLGDYLDEKLLSAEKAMVGSVPVGIAKAALSIPAGIGSSIGRTIGGETFSGDPLGPTPNMQQGVGQSDQEFALQQPVVRGLGPKKGMAPLLFAGGAYGEAPQTGAPADIARIGAADPFNLSDEAAFYRDWQRPPERIENYDQWLAQQDLKTRISPIKNGELNPHAAKNLLGSAVESAPQMATILGASWLGGPGAGAVAGSALGAGNAGADTARYEAERGFSDPEAAMTAALGGIASGATEAIPIGDMLKRGGAAALRPGFWNAVRQAGVNTGKNALEEMPQELTQNYIEAMTAADPARRMEYDISDPGSFAGRQLEIAAKAGLTSAGFSSVTEAPNLYRGARAKPADIIEGRDGATGMQPVDMKVPVEKGPSAAVAPNPDRSARVVPVGTSVPDGMAAMSVEGGLLIYDRATNPSRTAVKERIATDGLDAFLAQHGTPSASGQPSTTSTAQAAPPPLLVPPVAQTDAEVAELAKQIAARPAPPKALEPGEVAKKIERLVADPRTTPEEREILVAKYEQLTKVVRQRGQEAAVAKEMGPQDEPLDAGLPPPEADPYSDDFYLSEALQAAERSAGRTDRLGAPRPYNEQAGAAPFDAALLEDPPAEIPPAAVAERQRLEEAARAEQAVAQAETPPSPIEQLLSGVPPEVVAQAVEALAPVAAEAPAPKKEGLAERKNRERAEAKAAPKPKPVAKEAPVAQPVQQPKPTEKAQPVPAPIADPKAAEQHTPKQLKAAEQLVKLAYHSERTADGAAQKYAAEREVERAERDARAMGVDVDAISRSVGREPTGSDGDARPTVAKVVPESAEKTPQVTIETSPFMQEKRRIEEKLAAESTVEPPAPKKPKSPEAKAAEKAQKGKAEFNTPKTVEKKLAAAVAKEKALRAKRDADPENEALLDEYNDATAELYALTKEANGKGVSTLEVTKDDDTPSLMKTIPQREARVGAFGKNEPMSREAFSKALEAAKAKLPGIADLVDALDSQADLPSDVAAVANGDRIDGFTQNGRVVVVADGMTSAEHVAATLAHEAVGHLVPEQTFGKNEWRKRLDEMMASSTWFRDFVANFGKSEIGSRYKAAELASEAIAFEANRVLDDANYKPPNAYRMFIAKLREWLREAIGARRVIGLSKVLEFSDRDLAAFLARSKRTAETGLPKNRRKGDGKPSFAKGPVLARAKMPDDPIQIPEIKRWSSESVERMFADELLILKKAEDEAKKRGATGDVSMYQAADERHGRTAVETEDVQSQFVHAILKLASKGNVTLDEIGTWLYGSHAFDRNARGRKVDPNNPKPWAGEGWSDKEAREKLQKLEDAGKADALDEIANVVYAMLAYERKRIVEAGLATKEDVDGWVRSMGAFYVPLKHAEEEGSRSGNARGFSALAKHVKHATGRSTGADNPLFHAVSQVQNTIKRAHDADVGRELDAFFRENPNPDYWVEDPSLSKRALKTTKDDDGNLETTVQTVPDPVFLRDDIVTFRTKAGEVKTWQIKHPDMLRAVTQAFKGEDRGILGDTIRTAAAIGRLYGKNLTQLDLEFILKNPSRDIQNAAENIAVGYGETKGKDGKSKGRMIKTAAKITGEFVRSARGVYRFMRDPDSKDEYAKLYVQMRKDGATVGFSPFEDANKVRNRLIEDMNTLKRGKLDPREWAKRTVRIIEAANTIGENATRLAVYKTLGDMGITGRQRTEIVKDSTANFTRKGEAGSLLNTAYLFSKAAIAGQASMLKMARRSPARAAKLAAFLAAAGFAEDMLNAMFSGDDDDDGYSNYDELQESTKERNWIFGRKQFPRGHGWSVFANVGRHGSELMRGKKTASQVATASALNFFNAFNPIGESASFTQFISPWFADPFVQHSENRTVFSAPIQPPPSERPVKIPDSQNKFRSAPTWAVNAAEGLNALGGGDKLNPSNLPVVGEALDISPETIQFGSDWLVTGGLKTLKRLGSYALNAASGVETRTSDIPFVRSFTNSEHPGIDRGRYINQKSDLETKFNAAKEYKGVGKDPSNKDLDKYDALLSGVLRSRTDFMKMQKLYAQLDNVAQTPAIEDLKQRVMGVAARQYELAKRTDKYIPLDEGLVDDLTDKVELAAPKPEKADENPSDLVLEDLEGR